MREYLIPVFAAVVASIAPLISNGAGSLRTNPPSECKAPDNKCGCQSGSEVSSGCIKVNLDLGLTTPWSGSLDCALKIFADNESPDVFTCDSLYAVLGGYTFKRLGQDNLSDGENRPVLWKCDNTNIVMSFDRMGRRMTKNDLRFIYDGYLQIADSAGNSYTWDPTEPVATRPLVGNFSTVQPSTFSTAYYTHDGNKTVSDLIASDDAFAAHYEYAPFGFIAAQRGLAATANSWRFSSEFVEADTATVYYNYRHCEVTIGRWLCRDSIFERAFKYYSTNRYDGNEYLCGRNDINIYYDWLGRDNPGCDIPPSIVNGKKRDCLRRCCAKHDECYYSRGGTSPGGRCRCTANSWFKNAIDLFLRSNDEQEAYPNDPCKQCNSDVVRCFASCYADNDKRGPRWFFVQTGIMQGNFMTIGLKSRLLALKLE